MCCPSRDVLLVIGKIHYSSCLLSCIACELVRVACCQLTGELKVYWSGVRCWMCFSWESVFNGIVMIARYFGVYEWCSMHFHKRLEQSGHYGFLNVKWYNFS